MSTSASPPAAQKYDRQLRIWGEIGQTSLATSSLLVINATALAIEALKNLVLPGLASFTILDGQTIQPIDLSNNFFLHPCPSLTCLRAPVLARALHALNPTVSAAYIPQPPEELIRSLHTAAEIVQTFSAVLIADLGILDKVVNYVAQACYDRNIPLIYCTSAGFYIRIRLQVRELCIRDDKMHTIPDLRVAKGFKELDEYVKQVDLEKLHDEQLRFVPMVILLRKAVIKFLDKEAHLPSNREEKMRFKDIVTQMKPKHGDGWTNFEEALMRRNLRLAYQDALQWPDGLKKVMECEKSDYNNIQWLRQRRINTMTRKSVEEVVVERREDICTKRDADKLEEEERTFWILAMAVRKFFDISGTIPLSGKLPDMTANTQFYITLQKLYHARCESDAKQVHDYVGQLLEHINGNNGIDVEIDFETTREFCKHIFQVDVIRTRSIQEEIHNGDKGGFLCAAQNDMAMEASCKGSPMAYYAIERALQHFKSQHGREAGYVEKEKDKDIELVMEHLSKVKEQLGMTSGGKASGLWREEVEEMVRWNKGQMGNMSALGGGIVGQELTKVLTRMFVPLTDTTVMNMSGMSTTTFRA